MATLDIEEIEKRWQAATKGPYQTDAEITCCIFAPDNELIAEINSGFADEYNSEANIEFLANSWQDIKDLLEENKRMCAALNKIPDLLNSPGPSYIQEVLDLIENLEY